MRRRARRLSQAAVQREQLGRERAVALHAEEAGHAAQLSAGGGRGQGEGDEGGPVTRRAHRHRTDSATPEPAAAVGEPVGGRPRPGMPVLRSRYVG